MLAALLACAAVSRPRTEKREPRPNERGVVLQELLALAEALQMFERDGSEPLVEHVMEPAVEPVVEGKRPEPSPPDAICELADLAPPHPVAEEQWCLLLPATVTVGIDLTTAEWGVRQQRSASERQAMYAEALRDWIKVGLPIVFAENSGADLAWATELLREARGGGEALSIPPATACTMLEIGCHEAHALLDAIGRSKLLQPGGECTHALKVTPRYVITSNVLALPVLCAGRPIALQNPPFQLPNAWQATHVMGFDTRLTERLFGWARRGGACQECHMTEVAQLLRSDEEHAPCGVVARRLLCELPPMDIKPRKEGSTGVIRTQLERQH